MSPLPTFKPSRRDLATFATLLGVTLTVPGCTVYRRDFSLSDDEVALMDEIADVIIPPTDTPGAKDAEVGQFARMMVQDWFNDEERERFVNGLQMFDAHVRSRHGAPLPALSQAARIEAVAGVLEPAEAKLASPAVPQRLPRPSPANPAGSVAPALAAKPPFIVIMKRLTILGYYTSEIGAEKELDLNLIPGSYDGCAHETPQTHAGSILGLRAPSFSAG